MLAVILAARVGYVDLAVIFQVIMMPIQKVSWVPFSGEKKWKAFIGGIDNIFVKSRWPYPALERCGRVRHLTAAFQDICR